MKTLGSSVLRCIPRSRSLRKVALLALTLPFLAATSTNLIAATPQENGNEPYAIGLWGDLPYSTVQADGVVRLIADMNSQKLAFTVHDGDLKAGSSRCDNVVYTNALGYFNSLKAPAMFTPGDNDWTDCDRPSAGAYNPLERLDYERKLFFGGAYASVSMGQTQLPQEVQTEQLCLNQNRALTGCVENRRWTVGNVTYATLNIQGSCNNLCDVGPDPQEYAARNAAVIKWMKETFAVAKQRNSVAIMFISQGNPGWAAVDPAGAPLRDPKTLAELDGLPDGYQEFLLALRSEVIAFVKPVAYVHGDSHYFRIDKPFLNDKGQRLENFTRVETFGDNQANGTNDVQWLKVFVNPTSREIFSYQPQIVPGNRVAVPLPPVVKPPAK